MDTTLLLVEPRVRALRTPPAALRVALSDRLDSWHPLESLTTVPHVLPTWVSRRTIATMKPLVLSCCLLSLVTACNGTSAPRATPSPPPVDHTAGPVRNAHAVGQPGCRPPSPINTDSGLPEVHGTSRHIQMWGLIMTGTPGPVRVHEDVKIV
jgi:hypothetical protein